MEPATLSEIRTEIERSAALIGASGNLLPSYGQTRDFGYPHIEVDSRGYHYIVTERGRELLHIITPQMGELLYQVFESITATLAATYAIRRSMFPHQIELLTKLSPQWAERRSREHDK